ncbi:hypothetical protein ACFWYW_46640 [Nonomuraea sp. NPDC059023]|uniref:hypothetical protein n=1 Tax=unclassified Nonomuraea TaxID=2593643 RepID=UPI0036C3CD3F
MNITVPPLPEGLKSAACWRKTIAALNDGERGGAQIIGAWLHAGDIVDATPGTLIVAVDKKTLGWANHHRTGQRYAVEDAKVAVHLVTGDGLTELWSRHYKAATSAFGATTMKKITALLDAHPAPGGEVTVIDEAKRPNHKPGECRWCHTRVPQGVGHVVGHGEDAEVEHYRRCPIRSARDGDVCSLCGRTMVARLSETEVVMVREGDGRWEPRHFERLNCTITPLDTWEELQERLTAEKTEQQRAQAKRAKAAERRAAKAAEKKAAEQAAHQAEQDRVAGLKTTSRAAQELFAKNIAPGLRAHLLEYTDTLEDGTTTTRWGVTVQAAGQGWAGVDNDPDMGQATSFTRLQDAQGFYRGMQWSDERPHQPRGRRDRGCPGLDVPHCYGCGTTYAAGGFMSASTGTACPGCYDDLADAHGAHALQYHPWPSHA